MTKSRLSSWVLVISFLFISQALFAYSTFNEVDRLEKQLSEAKGDENRYPLLVKIAFELRRINPSKGIEYAQEALEIAESNDNQRWIARCHLEFANNYTFMGKKPESLSSSDKALTIASREGFEDIVADIHHIKGLTYFFMGLDKKAVRHYHQALEINERLERNEQAFRQLNNLSLVYRDIKRYDMAMEFLDRCDLIVDKLETHIQYKTFVSFNKGYVYLHMKEYEKALEYVLDATAENEKWKDSVYISISYNTLAVINNELGEYEKAIDYAQRSIEVSKKIGVKESEIYAIHAISEANNRQANYQKAIEEATKALNLSDTIKTQRYTEGILETLISSHQAVGNVEQAFSYQGRLLEFRDSLYNFETERMIDDLDIAYITREKDQENQLLRNENEEITQVVSLQKKYNRLSIGFGLLFLVLSVTLFLALNSRKKNNRRLEAAIEKRTKELVDKNDALQVSNRELERFAHVASHDLKEPLRNISSFANLIRRRTSSSDDQDLKEYTTFIINGTKQMDQLVQSILSFAKLSDNVEYEFENINLQEIADQIKAHLSLRIQERNVQLNIDKLPERVYGNADLLLLLIKNLIENGIKYNNSDQPVINVNAVEDAEYFQISIQDNGIGIEEEYHKKIFGMFTRLHNRMQYQGSGMGLSICKKIVAQHKGNIWVLSEVGKGSTFTFTIPKRNEKLNTLNTPKKISEPTVA